MEKRPKKSLLDHVRDVIRLKHYSIRTEKAYVNWIRRYILFHNKRHPKEMRSRKILGLRLGLSSGAYRNQRRRIEIKDFLTHLTVNERVAASTQNQAFNALLFLYCEVLKIQLDDSINAVRAKKPKRLPTVLLHSNILSPIEAAWQSPVQWISQRDKNQDFYVDMLVDGNVLHNPHFCSEA